MNRQFSVLAMLSACLGLATVASAEQSVDSVEKKISELLAKHKTIRIKDKSMTDMQTPDIMMKTQAESVMEYARRPEDKWVSRIESKTRIVRKLKDQAEEKEDGTILTVCDGQFIWILSDSPQMKSVMKTKLDPKQNVSPFNLKGMFELLKKDFDLKVLPDETVNGKSTYVIEVKPKKKEKEEAQVAQFFSRSVSYYDKKTGVAIKSMSYDDKGKVMASSEVIEVQTDADIAADRFVFKVPEGVTVMDLTQMNQQGQEAPAEEAKTETASESETAQPKKEEPKPEKTAEKPKEEKKDATKPLKGLLKGLK